MRLILTIVAIAVFAAIAEWFLPWWTAAVVAFIVAYAASLSTGKAFAAGFFGILLLWLLVMLYRNEPNQHILSGRMAQVFHLPNAVLYILIAVIIGGVAGGLAAWSGAHFRKLLIKR